MSVWRQHYTGAAVGVGGHPGAVDAEEHEHHEQRDDDDALDVHSDALVRLLLVVFVGASRLPDLQRQKHDPMNEQGLFTLNDCDYVNFQRRDFFFGSKGLFTRTVSVNVKFSIVTLMQRIFTTMLKFDAKVTALFTKSPDCLLPAGKVFTDCSTHGLRDFTR